MNAIDRKIIQSLGVKGKTAQYISQKTGIGKTTVVYRLQKMVTSRLVRKETLSPRKILYFVNAKSVNEARDSRLYEEFSKSQMILAYRHLADLPKHSVIYGVQSVLAAKKSLEKFPKETIQQFHDLYKKKGLVLKGISNSKVAEVFSQVSYTLRTSHSGRTVAAKLISGDIFMGPCEVLSSRDFFIISNFQNMRSIVVKDHLVANFVYEIFALLFNVCPAERMFRIEDVLV